MSYRCIRFKSKQNYNTERNIKMEKIDIEAMRKQFSAIDTKRNTGLKEPQTIEINKNITYGPYGIENLLDIYYPKKPTKLLPTIISIHGGGFFYGDKEIYKFYTMFLATQGFTVINFNYRLAPNTRYPAPLEDTNNLMNWILANHKEYFIDLENIFVVGDSAGAQIAEQYATLISNEAYEKLFDFKIAQIKFKAIALNCGVYFIGQNEEINKDFPYYFQDTIDKTLSSQFPVEKYITNNFPPTSIMTASHDFLKDLAAPFAKFLEIKQIPVQYNLYENEDRSELGHVFHLDQKSDIARICNLTELAFFKDYITEA